MSTNNAWNSQDPAQVAKGGTGRATLTSHGVLVGAGTSAVTQLTAGTNGQVLVGSTGADPVMATIASSDSSITVATGAGTLGLTTTAAGTSQRGGVILASAAEAIAGTDANKAITPSTLTSKLGTQTNHGVLVGAGTSAAVTALTVGTNGQVLVGSSAANPVFATLSSSDSSITFSTGAGTLGLATTAATTAQRGGVTLATNAEAIAGTDTAKAITSDDLKAKLGTQTNHGVLVGAGTSAAVTALAVGSTGTLLVGSSSADPAFATSANGDFTFTSSTAGATRLLKVDNTSNTASSAAAVQILTGGGTAFDPQLHFTVNGVTDFTAGIDNSDSDKFKIAASSTLGSTDTFVMTTAGERTMPLQPAFSVYMASNDNNVTGAGTSYKVGSGTTWTEIVDQNGDFDNSTNALFTAPVSGCYQFNYAVRMAGLTAAMTNATITLSLTGTSFVNGSVNIGAAMNNANIYQMNGSAFTFMNAGNTAALFIQIQNGAGDVADIMGGATAGTYFSGYLVC